MHYNYFFNGCSWTYGSDLQFIKRDRYSTIFSEGKTHENIAVGGSSNDRICLETIEWFERGNTCDLAVIQWTFCNRTLYWENQSPKRHNFVAGRKEFANKNIKEDFRLYYEYCNNRIGIENYYKNIFLLKTYFELKNIKNVMLCIRRYEKELTSWKFDNDPISICYDWNINIDIPSNLYIGGKLHPNEFGHQKIAQELKKIL